MKTDKILSIITPKTTGYSAAAGLGIAVISGAAKNKTLRKIHKPAAWAATGLTALHIGLIEYYHLKYKSK